ncbi:MAG: ABC-F family ATP-binding cassette domain-containing protein [Pyrinomonadaceae bacterium]|nr:ABC-F family ATP-binding cassette domain-containing protein [Pyrinomonadaceae bacterium]
MLFRFSEVYKSYGTHDILRGLTFQINPNEKVGLVGRNGAGKSTIFRLLKNEESADEGEVIKARETKLGFLAQHVEFTEDMTVHEVALSAFEKLQKIEIQMRELEEKMGEGGDDLDEILEKYSELQHEFEIDGGFDFHVKAETVLQGLGFGSEKWTLRTSELSGGQKNRLGLAKLLLSQPDVLLLDEPTNHLDVNSVEWLENFLTTYESAYVVISHDRYFLDRTCRRIIELENGKAATYTGNYSQYLIEREERREIQRRAFENQQSFINKTEEFVRKNLAGQKTKQAKSRRTLLERMDKLEAVKADKSQGNFKLKDVERAGNNVLMVEDLAIGYDDKVLAENINFNLQRGEALGIIGANGSGKTTFLKAILGKLRPLEGEARWGTKVEVGYYAQQLDDLDDRNEIIMELRRVAPVSATTGELRGFLAQFLFTGDDVYKSVGDLSGGEKGRLALAKLIYSKCNVLVLDEPTNHLDIPSCEALENALEAFAGTILTISHDRYFLDRVASQILNFDGKGNTEYFTGNYSEFHDAVAEGKFLVQDTKPAKTEPQKPKVQETPKNDNQKSKPKNNGAKLKTRPTDIIEKEIAANEAKLENLTAQMSEPKTAANPVKFKQVNDDFQKAESDLAKLYEEWEQVSENA